MTLITFAASAQAGEQQRNSQQRGQKFSLSDSQKPSPLLSENVDNADNGQVYCLSVQFDSRTGEAYSLSCALFDSVQTEQAASAIKLFLAADGYADSLAEQAVLTPTAKGYTGTLRLPDGLKLEIYYSVNEQYEIAFTR